MGGTIHITERNVLREIRVQLTSMGERRLLTEGGTRKVSEREAVRPRPKGLWALGGEMGRDGIVNKRKESLTSLNPEPLWR